MVTGSDQVENGVERVSGADQRPLITCYAKVERLFFSIDGSQKMIVGSVDRHATVGG